MPVRGLESYKKHSKETVYNRVSANILNDVILCVDGFWFLRKYSLVVNAHDVFMNNREERYLDPVLKLIKMAKDCKVELLWVWDGINYKKPTNAQDYHDIESLVSQGYDSYLDGDYVGATKHWKHLIDPTVMVEDINTLLKSLQIPFLTAPFSASVQIAYYLKENICGYAFGKNDVLIYEGVDKIITEIFFDRLNGFQVEILSKKNICDVLEIEATDFKPLSFALGCEFCPTLPEYASNFIFENILTIIKTEGLESYFEKNKEIKNYIEIYENAFVLTDYHPVMKENGKVLPYSEENVPENIHLFFGQKLPDIFYERQFLNLISPEILTNLAFQSFNDTDPLFIDVGNSIYSIIKDKIDINVLFDGGLSLEKKFVLSSSPNKLEFIESIFPNIRFDSEFDLVSQMVLSKMVEHNLLKSVDHHKVLCCHPKFHKLKDSKELVFDKESLLFYLKCIRLRNLFKQCKEVYELVSNTELTISFKERYCLVAPAYYIKNENKIDDPAWSGCYDFIKKASNFIVTNYGLSNALLTQEVQ